MKIVEWVSIEEINQLLKEIIAIESHKEYKYREYKVAKWMEAFFRKEKIEVRLEEVEPRRPNVIASLGNNKTKEIKLMLNGHIDTVPGYNMAYPPFEPFIKEGKIYGRGSADMKGAIVAMMVSMAAIKRSGIHIEETILFSGVIDEEERSKGTEDLVNRGYKPEYAIFGEPTNLNVCTSHKGMEWVEITFHGESTHGSRPEEGNNAVYAASEFCQLIEKELQGRLASRKNPELGSGTISVGRIKGGDDPNIVPALCRVELDRRWLPEEKIEDVNNEIKELAKKVAHKRNMKVAFRIMKELTASTGNNPYQLSNEDAFCRLVTDITKEVKNEEVTPMTFSAWSDAGILGVQTDAKCLILGPGSINQAHASDEFCSLEEIYQASKIYFTIIEALGGK